MNLLCHGLTGTLRAHSIQRMTLVTDRVRQVTLDELDAALTLENMWCPPGSPTPQKGMDGGEEEPLEILLLWMIK